MSIVIFDFYKEKLLMKEFDTLIIGCGYASVGYALAKGNCLIVEEGETADTYFYLPLKDYIAKDYTPVCQEAKQLKCIFEQMNIYGDGMINLNKLECAFCEFISQTNVKIYFRTNVVEIKKQKDGYVATLLTVNGLTDVKAKKILDARATEQGDTTITLLFASEQPEQDKLLLEKAFLGAKVQQAFFKDRYALTIPTTKNYSKTLVEVLDKWKQVNPTAKIIYFAPKLYVENQGVCDLYDGRYTCPEQALESGISLASKEAR